MEIRIISINDETIETWSNALLVRPGEIGEVVSARAYRYPILLRRPSVVDRVTQDAGAR
jgi:hypothetical protein